MELRWPYFTGKAISKVSRWYFGKHYDKVLVWALSVVIPLLLIWAAYFGFNVFGGWGCAFTLIGLLAPACNIWLGRRMIRTVSRDVEEKLDQIVKIYQKLGVPLAVEKARRGLPGGSVSDGGASSLTHEGGQ